MQGENQPEPSQASGLQQGEHPPPPPPPPPRHLPRTLSSHTRTPDLELDLSPAAAPSAPKGTLSHTAPRDHPHHHFLSDLPWSRDPHDTSGVSPAPTPTPPHRHWHPHPSPPITKFWESAHLGDLVKRSTASTDSPQDTSGSSTPHKHHIPKSIRPFVLSLMAFEKGRKFSTGTSVHRKRKMSTLVETEGHFGPALTVCSRLFPPSPSS